MLVVVIATLCLSDVCVQKIVTDQASLMQCSGPFGEQAISKWMTEEGYSARGYRLAKWGCQLGKRAVGI
jgi:hypothetical protein